MVKKYLNALISIEKLILHYSKGEKNKDMQIELSYALNDLGEMINQEIELVKILSNVKTSNLEKFSKEEMPTKNKEPQQPQKSATFEVAPSKNTRKDN